MAVHARAGLERLRKEGCDLVYRCAKQQSEPSSDKRGTKAGATQTLTFTLLAGGIDRQNLRGFSAAVPAVWWADAPDRVHDRGHTDQADFGSHRGRLGATTHIPGARATVVG